MKILKQPKYPIGTLIKINYNDIDGSYPDKVSFGFIFGYDFYRKEFIRYKLYMFPSYYNKHFDYAEEDVLEKYYTIIKEKK